MCVCVRVYLCIPWCMYICVFGYVHTYVRMHPHVLVLYIDSKLTRGNSQMYARLTHSTLCRLLEEELLCVASYYLQKSHSSTDRGSDDIDVFSHRKADRFGVLLDLWTCEEQYQQDKKKVRCGYMHAWTSTPE